MRAKRHGFTLIELLVAIGIMAIVAVLGWRGLDSIVRARVSLTTELGYTRGLQLAFAQMQSDGTNIATPEQVPNRELLQADPGRIAMVRTVFTENQPSRVQVIAYRLRDGMLTRTESVPTRDLRQLDQAWTAAITDADATQPVVLSANVGEMAVRGWSTQNTSWVINPRMRRAGATQTQSPVNPGGGQGGAPVQPVATPTSSALDLVTGLEVSLRMQNSASNLVKIFLLGPV
jgi:general secretion pathway protein J